jgi:hypothetical protein
MVVVTVMWGGEMAWGGGRTAQTEIRRFKTSSVASAAST